MKKRFLVILLALAATLCLAFALSACSPAPNDNTGNTTEQSGNSGNSGNNSGSSGSTGNTNTPEGGGSESTTEPETPDTGDEGDAGSTNPPDSDNTDDMGETDSDNDGHVWSEWIVISPATCSKQGLEGRICTSEKHSEHYETRETQIDPTAHDFGELITTPATCTTKGVEAHYHCTCGKFFNKDKIEILEQQLLTLPVDNNGHILNKGESTCANCGTTLTVNLKYSLLSDNTYSVSKGSATDSNIIIPAIYDGKPVTAIGNFAFSSCSSLKSIVIPNSVTSIDKNAFWDCTNLTSITISDSVTSIGDYAFSSCRSLESIAIPDGVTSIGDEAFHNCYSLKSVNFGNDSKLEIIGDYAFEYCTSLISINFGDNSKLETIGDMAFYDCTSLTSITIPDSVTSIGGSAFLGCTSLERINVGENNTAYSSESGILYNKSKTQFIHIPTAVKGTITIPDGITSIGSSAFSENKKIETVIIGTTSKLETIGESAFLDCTSLKSITIPKSVTSIGKNAFYNCNNINKLYITDLVAWCNIDFGNVTANPLGKNLYLNYDLITELHIPQEVKEIKNYVFAGYNGTSIIIPDGVTSIGAGAFSDCANLISITIPKSVTSIGAGAFNSCYELKYVYFENNSKLETIGDKAFYHSVIINISIPDSVTSIGESAFENCYYLASMRFGDNSKLETIGNEAFYMCSRLNNITIPDSVTSIGNRAFARCSILASITIPKNVTYIGADAFYGCIDLSSVTFANKNGWKVGNSIDVNVGISSENAKMLKDTYRSSYWKREG